MFRTKLRIGIVIMLFAFAVGGNIASADESLLPQVVYEFEVYEVETIEEQALILEAITLRKNQSRELGFTFSLEGGALDLLSPTPIQVTALNDIEKKIRMATPGLVVVLGRTSTLRVVEERLVSGLYSEERPFQLSGIEISVSPVQITGDGAIFSVYDINTFDSDNTFHTEVWNRAGERVFLCMVELEGERFLAISVTASLATNLDGSSYSVASVGRLGDLIWVQPSPVLEWESRFWIVLPINPIELPEGGFALRLDHKFYVDGEYQSSASYSHLGFGASIMDEAPSIDIRWIYAQKRHLLALGITDRVEAYPGLFIAAGFMPLVFDLGDRNLQKPHWWVQLEAEYKPLRASIRYQSDSGESGVLNTRLGYELMEHAEVFSQLSCTRDSTRIGLGLSLDF